ncbi:hypothetical protein M758_7G128300 [Ceratodon purpureus]|nr:hypothetical protein M758_7G128300 [Ceratodon purpureus]
MYSSSNSHHALKGRWGGSDAAGGRLAIAITIKVALAITTGLSCALTDSQRCKAGRRPQRCHSHCCHCPHHISHSKHSNSPNSLTHSYTHSFTHSPVRKYGCLTH